MTDPFKQVLELNAKLSRFPPTSRYYGIETVTRKGEDGRTVLHLSRRFVPPPDRFMMVEEHVITEGDRIDNLAAGYLGDPELYWRICDANAVMRPEELTDTLGRRVRITLPENITGVRYG